MTLQLPLQGWWQSLLNLFQLAKIIGDNTAALVVLTYATSCSPRLVLAYPTVGHESI